MLDIFFFQFGTRVKIDTPLSYVVREDQALTNHEPLYAAKYPVHLGKVQTEQTI